MKAEVLGRGEWLKRLAPLPPVTLLRSPGSTGKRTVAQHAARAAGVSVVDQMIYPVLQYQDEYGRAVERDFEGALLFEPDLSIDHVRELRRWSRTVPLASPFKVAIIRLDHERDDGTYWRASARTLAAMLKILEEPPATVRFVLLTTKQTLPMIASRSVELTAGLLTTDCVAEIIYRISELSETESKSAAQLGGGRVAPSLAFRADSEASKQAVIDVLTSLAAGDTVALTEKSRIWTDSDTQMLVRWAHERISGRWSCFVGSEASLMSSSAAERVLRVIRASSSSRPRVVLGAVSALAVK